MKRKPTAARARRRSIATTDFPPLTTKELAKLRPVALVKAVRWGLGLSQEDFSKRYKIPLGTLRDWEQRRANPDQAAVAYLRAIAGEPEKIAKVHAKNERALERA